MDGVINVLKPKGITSFDVVRDIRKIAKIKKSWSHRYIRSLSFWSSSGVYR